jgi:hypothetical protein
MLGSIGANFVKPLSSNHTVVCAKNDGDRASAAENFEMTLLNNTDRSQTQTSSNCLQKHFTDESLHCAPNSVFRFLRKHGKHQRVASCGVL